MLEIYAGFGSVLGHNFPCYLQFKGGKGIACTSGMILAVCPAAAPICLLLFILAVAITRYVSLGSILVLKLEEATLIEFYVISACFTVMALWRHRQNIVRLLNGTENKFGMKKEK